MSAQAPSASQSCADVAPRAPIRQRRQGVQARFTIRDRLQHAIGEHWDVLQRIPNEAHTPTRCFEFGQRVAMRRRAATPKIKTGTV